MDRDPVDSTQLKSVGYDQKNRVLEIEYLNGGNVVRYYSVSPQKFKALMSADSKGGFVSDKIKGSHRFREVN
jgi:hypothetical protein